MKTQAKASQNRKLDAAALPTSTYTDAAVSGASMMHPGIQSLIQGALSGAFDIVLYEALDRFSQNLSDIAALFPAT